MRCPECGADTAAIGGRCSSCNALLTPASNAAGLSATSPLPSSQGDETRVSGVPSVRAAEGPLQPGDAFGPRYRILRVLGSGRHGRRLPGVGRGARRRRRAQGDPAGGDGAIPPRRGTSSAASSASCCSRARSPTRTSSASTTSARSTASSTSRCRSSRATTSRSMLTRERQAAGPAGAAHRAADRRRARGRARRGRRAPRPEAREHHDRRATASALIMDFGIARSRDRHRRRRP